MTDWRLSCTGRVPALEMQSNTSNAIEQDRQDRSDRAQADAHTETGVVTHVHGYRVPGKESTFLSGLLLYRGPDPVYHWSVQVVKKRNSSLPLGGKKMKFKFTTGW